MKNDFNEYIECLSSYRWVGVKDLSEDLQISKRTIFTYLKEGKFESVKWKGRRLIDTISVLSYFLKKKSIEMRDIKLREIRDEIELKEFQESV